jgi:hypothetical protein
MGEEDEFGDLGPVQALALAHWRSLRPDPTRLPAFARFDPLALGAGAARLLPSLWVLDVDREAWRFRYRLLGERVRGGNEAIRPGELLNDVDPTGDAVALLIEVCRTRRPALRKGRPMLPLNEHITALETIILPMASDGETVDVLLNCTTYTWANDLAPFGRG